MCPVATLTPRPHLSIAHSSTHYPYLGNVSNCYSRNMCYIAHKLCVYVYHFSADLMFMTHSHQFLKNTVTHTPIHLTLTLSPYLQEEKSC